MTSRAGIGFGIALVVLGSGLLATHGFALTFDVDTTADGPDNIPGDGICATVIGPCSLRAAIEEANELGGAHTINLPQGYYHAGDHVITANIAIHGPSGISAHDRPGVIGGSPTFTIESGARVSMTDVSISFGDNTDGPGCILNEGELELTNVGLYACTGTWGGAISNLYWLTMTGCDVEDSEGWHGGGLLNDNTRATLTEVAFRRNRALNGDGGAIRNSGTLSLTDCWLDDNEASGNGGGLSTTVLWALPNLTRVTVSRNVAGSQGGGVWAAGDSLTLTNVTIHSNSAGDVGGGLYLKYGSYGLVNVTIYGNADDGLATGPDATVQVVNTLFYNFPLYTNCLLESPISSYGHNLEVSGDTCGLNGPGDLVNVAHISTSAVGLYGGFGETVPLVAGSPGIDDGDTALAPPTDQRGVQRFDGDGDGTAAADIGAYEYGPFFHDGFESGDTSWWSATVP